MTGAQMFLAGFLVGCAVVGLPAFWLARAHRAHHDYRGAKEAVPKARAVRTAAGKALVKVSLLGLAALAVALYAAARTM
ncbi:hypothetical protein [Actinocatenispora comari]|uniref:Uncharacterized protein n=1 Tax=Actinocatenispora comari TaxID=2807577 RepID=A0A8J4ANG6_9ACTN|nr:hypothetical protein [Actinocatenispora comari]GIL32058.1 hypothetical protein NUM_73120 [Actinocatenispora comari]